MGVDPANLAIVHYPDPVLRQPATKVEQIDDTVIAVAHRMIELMREAAGIGLAAPQVGLPWRLFVVDVPAAEDDAQGEFPVATDGARVLVNPVLSDPRGTLESQEEGCLSLPEIHGKVMRPPHITVEATTLEGETFKETAAGLLARCYQHEFDHLNGTLIIDKMDQMSRLKNRAAIRALERT